MLYLVRSSHPNIASLLLFHSKCALKSMSILFLETKNSEPQKMWMCEMV